MPKIKTHRATAKRFRRSKGGKGKLMQTRGRKGHFRRKRRKSRKRLFYQMKPVTSKGTINRVRRLMPKVGRLSAHKQGDGDVVNE